MHDSKSKWLNWMPERPSSNTGKTGETSDAPSFAGFAGKVTGPFSSNLDDLNLANQLSDAIAILSEMCPGDFQSRISREQRWQKRELDRIGLDTESEIQRWFDGWRMMFAEMLIDSINEANRTSAQANYTKVVWERKR